MKNSESIKELWELYISDQATPAQVNALFEQIKSDDDNDHIVFIKEAVTAIPQSGKTTDDIVIDSILEAIISSNKDLRTSLEKNIPTAVVRRIPPSRQWAWAAAAVFLLAGIGAYLWIINKKDQPTSIVSIKASDIKPGRNGGILTLADGRQVVLDSAGNGVIATQSGAQVVLKNGQLSYIPTGTNAGTTAFNTVSTPKGRQFSLVLPDGTRVWLDAASTLRYPTIFAGDQRQVDITGEAYFEVAKNVRMPFHVIVNNKISVDVLGTHFNVDAYSNEDKISTTLLEGSVNISVLSNGQPSPIRRHSVILKPGQQAQTTGSGDPGTSDDNGIIKVMEADIDKTMAWKNGLFYFDGAGLYQVMQQIERWYDIEIVIDKGVRNSEFVGKLTRDVTLDQLLEGFKEFGVHYKLEGRKLTLLP